MIDFNHQKPINHYVEYGGEDCRIQSEMTELRLNMGKYEIILFDVEERYFSWMGEKWMKWVIESDSTSSRKWCEEIAGQKWWAKNGGKL